MAEVSDIWIKLNYWYLNNRRDLTRWWALLLLGADLILIAFVVTNGIASLIGYGAVNTWVSEMGSSRVIGADATSRNTPRSLIISQVESVVDGKGGMLYLATIKNPNQFWSVDSAQYVFTASSGSTEAKETFISAGEERMILGSGNFGSQMTLELSSISWTRTPSSKIPEVPLVFSEAEHKFVTVQGTSSVQAVSQVATTVTNNSLYDIQDMKIVVVVRNGSTLVNAKQFFIEDLKQRETRELTFQFSSALGQFSDILFYPEVNVLDQSTLAI